MTNNAIRVRMGTIVERVFTKDFTDKYANVRAQVDESSALLPVAAYKEDVDSFIQLAAAIIDRNDLLVHLSRIAHPLVVYGVFVRYHFVTQFLISSNQDDERIMPNNDKSFFKAFLIDFWNEVKPEMPAGLSM